jgi:uroporphyrinogen III methyltransferase/synthase
MENKSTVYITGAGPGDPDLLTLKAKEILEKADVIAYDNLVSNEILELALFTNPNVKLLYVGKDVGNPERTVSQEKTLKLLLELSKDYKTICRLKGGDPNVFGRGGEEAIFLKENNINFEFIPGVSSITAVSAYAGIPLTHRDCTSSFTVITAHEDPEDSESSIKWENFDSLNSTLVLLMGTRNLTKITEKLISLGRDKDTPLAIIYKGTTSSQKTLISTLQNIKGDLEKTVIKHPSVIIIGKVVSYREVLNWFETKKLFGKRVLVTRSKEQSFSFASKLIKSGAKPILCPTVSYSIIEKEIYNKNIINNLSSFDWIFFTSQNSVKFFFEILSRNCFDSRALSSIKIASVGYKTNIELEKYNIKADFIPKRFSMEDLIKELSEKEDLSSKKILVPSQDIEREAVRAIPALLARLAPKERHELPQPTYWGIYHASFINDLPPQIIDEINKGIDLITLFSSNTAKNLFGLIEKHDLKDKIKNTKIAVIGEETAKTTKDLFGRTDIVAEPYTEEGLISSIENYFSVEMLPAKGGI